MRQTGCPHHQRNGEKQYVNHRFIGKGLSVGIEAELSMDTIEPLNDISEGKTELGDRIACQQHRDGDCRD